MFIETLIELKSFFFRSKSSVPTTDGIIKLLKLWNFNPHLIFEIGCCEGEDTEQYVKAFSDAEIYGFEPVPTNVVKAKKRLQRFKNVTVEEMAMADFVGSTLLYKSFGVPPKHARKKGFDHGNKSSSLLPPKEHLNYYNFIKFDKIKVKACTVDQYCLDHQITEIDFVHMDVQGAELCVLHGAERMLNNIKLIWMEVSKVELYEKQPLHRDIEEFMKKKGFSLILDDLSGISGDQLWGNRSKGF